MNISKKKIVIKGHKVKDVGYRPFLFEVATRKLLPYFDVVNNKEVDKDGNEIVEVFVGGPEDDVDNFIEFIKGEDNKPKDADVESIEIVEKDYKGGIMTIESFSMWLNSNQLSKFITIGTKIATGQDKLRIETNENFGKMDDNFAKMDVKYKLISEGMFAIVNELRETNKILGEKLEKTEKNIEKTDKNIEKLLEILIQQKK